MSEIGANMDESKIGIYEITGRFLVDGKVGEMETRTYRLPNIQEAEKKMMGDGLVRSRSDIGTCFKIKLIDHFSQIKLFHDDITIRWQNK